MLGLNSNHVSKRGPRYSTTCVGRLLIMFDRYTWKWLMRNIFSTGLNSGGICPRASCQDRCRKSSADDHSLCSCDHRCHLLGDCCVDISIECSSLMKSPAKKTYDSYRGYTAIIQNSNATAPDSEAHLFVVFTQIDYCPTFSKFHEKCKRAAITEDLRRHIPVCHPKNQVVFVNQYCAFCHGYHMNDLVPFELHVDNPSACDDLSTHTYAPNKSRISLEQLINNCTTHYLLFVPERCFAAVYRNKWYIRTNQPMCKSHLNPVVNKEAEVYRNKHCRPTNTTSIECFNGVWPSAMPFNVPKEVNITISLDISGVPVLYSLPMPTSKTPKICVSFNVLLALYARTTILYNWPLWLRDRVP